MNYLRYPKRFLRHVATAPVIYSVIVPVVIADVWIEVYHRMAFPFYGIPYVQRRNYIKIDRQKLSYLDGLQKINCMYCGYVNGVFQYWVKIAGETEKYWCGIRHRKRKGFVEPPHHKEFVEYGDEKAYRKKYLDQ